jgi:2-keto-4-pentenoate hydratase
MKAAESVHPKLSVDTAVKLLLDARSSRRPLAPLTEADPGLTVKQAYAIQDALRGEAKRRGEASIGWKLGSTRLASRAVMGGKGPAAGFLFSNLYTSGAEVSLGAFVKLAVEVEVAFRMRTKTGWPGGHSCEGGIRGGGSDRGVRAG